MEKITVVSMAPSGATADVLLVGLFVLVVFLLGALGRSAGALAGVIATAMGCLFRIVGVIVIVVVLLIGLVFTAAESGSADTSGSGPHPTVAPVPAATPSGHTLRPTPAPVPPAPHGNG